MPIRRARWIILGEGKRDLLFVRAWLRARGVHQTAIQARPVPASTGCGAQHVRDHLPTELNALRCRRGEAIVLIVITDADTYTVAQRIESLGDRIEDEPERLVLLIPRRNLETWIAYLHDEPVDESTDYKQRFGDNDLCRAGARRLAELRELPPGAPDSLRRAFGELARLRVP